jgi:hypothetical protein
MGIPQLAEGSNSYQPIFIDNLFLWTYLFAAQGNERIRYSVGQASPSRTCLAGNAGARPVVDKPHIHRFEKNNNWFKLGFRHPACLPLLAIDISYDTSANKRNKMAGKLSAIRRF